MKILYSRANAIIVVIAFFLLPTYKRTLLTVKAPEKPGISSTGNVQRNPYGAFRKQALSITSEKLGLKISNEKETAFGVVMEVGTAGGTATTVSFGTGDASIYFSSGGGIIGGFAHENIKAAAIDFVTSAQRYFLKMTRSENIKLPRAGHIKFFILTNRGRYSFEGAESEIANLNSPWAELFFKGNELITQLRLSTEKN